MTDSQYNDTLTQLLSLKEIEHHLNYSVDPKSDSTLFDLSPSDISTHNALSKHIQEFQNATPPLLNDRLKNKCERIYAYLQAEQDNLTASRDGNSCASS